MEAYYRVFDTLLADTMPAVRGKPMHAFSRLVE
jgi:hypothetical protein